jgi:hypothetical protein
MPQDQIVLRLIAKRAKCDRPFLVRNANRRLVTCFLVALGCALIAAGQSPIQTINKLSAGIRETAKHRRDPPPVRCLASGGSENVYMWLNVDAQGRALSAEFAKGSRDCSREVQRAAFAIRYVPFMQNGSPVEARVQEVFTLISAEEIPARVVPFPSDADPSRISVQLSRSGCFGSCPSYTVSIGGDGKVTYRGSAYVSISGEHVSQIDGAAVTRLLELFRAANFFALKDQYWASITDVPTYHLSLKIGNRVKTVEDSIGERVGMPTVVTELEAAVDLAADTARWVTSSPSTPEAMRKAGISFNSPEAARILRGAVSVGDVATVRALLDAGTPVASLASSAGSRPALSFDQPSTESLLQLAVESAGDRLQTLQTVLASTDVRADRRGLQQSLARAVESGETDLARALINAGADPTARLGGRYERRTLDRTYLMLAAASGVWAMIDDALSRPHDFHAADSKGRTALFHIAYSAPQIEDIFPLVDRFLAAGAERAELDQILLGTCQPNWIPGLVARGGNINAHGKGGNTPLFQTCTIEGVQSLLDAGADPDLRNDEGKTAVEQTFPPTQGREDSRAAVIRRFIEARRPRKVR